MTFDSTLAYNALHPYFHQRMRSNEPLASHSSFGVGGSADIWLSLETQQELNTLITLCGREHWPLLLVGAGSNILYADAGVRGIVASMALQSYSIEELTRQDALLIAEPGVRWVHLLKELAPRGWGGLEFGIGIPGTLGAGIISNVGAHDQEVGQALEWIEELDARACNQEVQEEPQTLPVTILRRYQHDELDLGYRHSRFREQRLTQIDSHGHLVLPQRGLIEPAELIVTLALRLHRQDPAVLEALLEHHAQERKQNDPAQRHLGSIFKNPAGNSVRTLLEQTGIAGRRHGNAQISECNANYIVNLGGATASDIAALIVEAHQEVLAHRNIHLMLNVELLGEWDAV